jgi:hypothetical protein
MMEKYYGSRNVENKKGQQKKMKTNTFLKYREVFPVRSHSKKSSQ